MTKVVHVIDELSIGGAQVYLLRLLQGYRQSPTFHHHVICLFGDGEFRTRLEDIGISVQIMDLRNCINSKNYFSAIKQLQKAIKGQKPDIVTTHLSWSRFLTAGINLPIKQLKIVAIEHGDIYLNSFKWKALNFALQWQINRIVPVSHQMKKWLQKNYQIFNYKMTVLHNCIDTSQFQPSDHPLSRRDLQIDEQAFVFCAIGTLGRGVNKRMDVGIRAIAHLAESQPKIHLIICGDGEQRTELEDLARNLKVSKNIHFLGKRSDIPDILQISDGFCHMAPFEPFGLVCLEAMAMSRPVIIPNSGGIQEIIEDGENGLKYESLNHEQLAQKMLLLFNNSKLAKAIANSGYKLVKTEYQMKNYIERLNQIYLNL